MARFPPPKCSNTKFGCTYARREETATCTGSVLNVPPGATACVLTACAPRLKGAAPKHRIIKRSETRKQCCEDRSSSFQWKPSIEKEWESLKTTFCNFADYVWGITATSEASSAGSPRKHWLPETRPLAHCHCLYTDSANLTADCLGTPVLVLVRSEVEKLQFAFCGDDDGDPLALL